MVLLLVVGDAGEVGGFVALGQGGEVGGCGLEGLLLLLLFVLVYSLL